MRRRAALPSRRGPAGRAWRVLAQRAAAILAAYLLVAQAALAGSAPAHHGAGPAPGPAVICSATIGAEAEGVPGGPEPAVDLGCCASGCWAMAGIGPPAPAAASLRPVAEPATSAAAKTTGAPLGPARDRRLRISRAPPGRGGA